MPRISRPTVRGATVMLLAALALTVAFAACGQASGAGIPTANESQATASPSNTNQVSAPVDEADAALVYAQCIRANGFPEWPDPNADGQIMITRGQGMDFNDPRRLAAMEACQDLRPAGLGSGGLGAGGQTFGDQEAILEFAQCMRANGVPEFPDPSATGGGMVIGPGSGIDPNSPTFQAALQTCRAGVAR